MRGVGNSSSSSCTAEKGERAEDGPGCGVASEAACGLGLCLNSLRRGLRSVVDGVSMGARCGRRPRRWTDLEAGGVEPVFVFLNRE